MPYSLQHKARPDRKPLFFAPTWGRGRWRGPLSPSSYWAGGGRWRVSFQSLSRRPERTFFKGISGTTQSSFSTYRAVQSILSKKLGHGTRGPDQEDGKRGPYLTKSPAKILSFAAGLHVTHSFYSSFLHQSIYPHMIDFCLRRCLSRHLLPKIFA